MAIEIERKYLVKTEEWRSMTRSTKRLRQGYLCVSSAASRAEVRIRCTTERAFVTIKGPGILLRSEFEYEIPLPDAELMLLEFCPNNTLEKIRHVVEFDGLLWEIDEFVGPHQGLILAEVELREPMQEVRLPSWIGKDVTEDPKFRNAHLASNPQAWRHPE
jgi:CYTH domain-containing protein